MNIFCLSDHYAVWTKSTIIELLQSVGDEDFRRSDSKVTLLERLKDYFVLDVLDVASLKALTQIAEVVGVRLTTKKGKKDALLNGLQTLQVSMKKQAQEIIINTNPDSEEMQRLLRIVLGTDSETAEVFMEYLAEELADVENDDQAKSK